MTSRRQIGELGRSIAWLPTTRIRRSRALVEHLVTEGSEAGWRKVHWLTDTDNATARRLYDEVGERADQVRYIIEL